MKKAIQLFLILLLISIYSCQGQVTQHSKVSPTKNENPIIGGPFQNNHLFYIGMPNQINAIDTSAGWNQLGQKLLITGTIFQRDGKTPAPNVILYYYHTDINGLYSKKAGIDQKASKHGYIRGWVKSDLQGKYSIYTVRPASYPNSDEPAHIHPAVKEPNNINEYYLDALVFDDDKFLTSQKRKAHKNRGGSGVLRVLLQDDLQIAEHNIILGLNIPNYPTASQSIKY